MSTNNTEGFYSQHGEDILLSVIFAGKTNGYFVEIGAHDGMHLSNTLHFEQAGWIGALVEAHPLLFEALKKNRPNSHCEHAAIGNSREPLIFYMSDIGSLSTFDKEQKEYFIRTRSEVTEQSYSEVFISPIGTNEFLRRAGAPKIIDFMTVDIEGGELDALETLNFEEYDVKVIVVEKDRHRMAKDRLVSELLERRGYRAARMVGINQFWVRDEELFKKVASVPFEGILDRRFARGAHQQNVAIKYEAYENARNRTALDRLKSSFSKRWEKLRAPFSPAKK